MKNLDKQVLLVLCDEDEGNKDFLKGYKDISPDVQVISERKLPKLRKQYELPDCRPGDILIEHPFKNPDGNFIRLGSDTLEKLRRLKLHTICHIAELLGAKRCHVINATGSEKTRNLEMIAKGNFHYLDSEVSIKREDVEKANYKESIESEGPGIETLTHEEYFKAHDCAVENNLESDPEVKRLLDGRNPNHRNRLKSLRVEISTQSEINQLIDIAATCWAMDIFKLQCNYRETLEYRADYSLILEFEFP